MGAALGSGLQVLRDTLDASWNVLEAYGGSSRRFGGVLTAMLSKDGPQKAQESEHIDKHCEEYDLERFQGGSWAYFGGSWGASWRLVES